MVARLKLADITSLAYVGITINLNNGPRSKKPLGQDARVRQALELSIDREALAILTFPSGGKGGFLIEAGEGKGSKRDNVVILQSRKASHTRERDMRRVHLIGTLIGHIAGLGARIHSIQGYYDVGEP